MHDAACWMFLNSIKFWCFFALTSTSIWLKCCFFLTCLTNFTYFKSKACKVVVFKRFWTCVWSCDSKLVFKELYKGWLSFNNAFASFFELNSKNERKTDQTNERNRASAVSLFFFWIFFPISCVVVCPFEALLGICWTVTWRHGVDLADGKPVYSFKETTSCTAVRITLKG
mgnify:CR=1 FL=1